MQSRRASMVEAIFNVVIGYLIAVATQLTIFPLFGLRASFSDNLLIAVIFTAASLMRSYALRRVFERWRVSARRKGRPKRVDCEPKSHSRSRRTAWKCQYSDKRLDREAILKTLARRDDCD